MVSVFTVNKQEEEAKEQQSFFRFRGRPEILVGLGIPPQVTHTHIRSHTVD